MRKKSICCLMLVAVVLLCAFGFVACNNYNIDDNGGKMPQGHYPSKFSDNITESERQIINAAIADGATTQQKKAAAIAMYDIANRSRISTETSLVLQDSMNFMRMGRFDMHGFTLRSGDAMYYQLATEVKCDDDFVNAIMSAVAGNLQVGYTLDGDDWYYAYIPGSQTECDVDIPTFPFADFKLIEPPTKYTKEEFINERNALVSHFEIVNYVFCEEILKDDVSIVYNSNEKYYTVTFSIDIENGDSELLERFWEHAMLDQKKGAGDNSYRKYQSYDVTLELWDNGYAKYYKGDEQWKAPGIGEMDFHPTNEFYYIWNESEIMDILDDDQRIDLRDKLEYMSPMQYIQHYCNVEVSKARMTTLTKIIIGVCVPVGAALVTWIVIEILIKAGKLPKLAKRRALKKQAKAEKKSAKNVAKANKDTFDLMQSEGITNKSNLIDFDKNNNGQK